eukprot:4743035-Amphidinium_carterae.1
MVAKQEQSACFLDVGSAEPFHAMPGQHSAGFCGTWDVPSPTGQKWEHFHNLELWPQNLVNREVSPKQKNFRRGRSTNEHKQQNKPLQKTMKVKIVKVLCFQEFRSFVACNDVFLYSPNINYYARQFWFQD